MINSYVFFILILLLVTQFSSDLDSCTRRKMNPTLKAVVTKIHYFWFWSTVLQPCDIYLPDNETSWVRRRVTSDCCDVWSQLPRTTRGTSIHVIASREHRVGWVASLTGAGALHTRNSDGMRAQNSTWLSLSSYFIRFSVESNKAGEVEVVGTVFYRGYCMFHTSITIGRVK
jgi:hypothetical protein